MSIELRAVSKRVGAETHIHTTDLTLEAGGFNVLLGNTLAGKTTLMRLMAGLETPSSGQVWFDGHNVTGVAVQKRQVAMVYQAFVNYPNLNVYDNIASPLRVAKVRKPEIDERVRAIAGLLKLTAMLDRLPAELSGGQQQRTALARALVKNAPLVLLDEPLANLDYKLREELRDELPRLFRDSGTTVVYATSEPLEALMLGGHIAIVHEGAVVQYGPTASIYREPANLLSARVFSDPPINTASVTKSADRFKLNEGVSWPVPPAYTALEDGPYLMGFRAHHLTLGEATPGTVEVSGVVQVAEISGSESVVHVKVDEHNWVSESSGVHSFEVGDRAMMRIRTDRCLYFKPTGERLRA